MRNQHVDLPELGDDLFRIVLLLGIPSSSIWLESLLQGGPLFRGQATNDSRYGLGGGIVSKDEERALKLARDRFYTGMVRINSFGAADPNMPFGGVEDSGYGREHGGFGMKECVNAKAIFLP